MKRQQHSPEASVHDERRFPRVKATCAVSFRIVDDNPLLPKLRSKESGVISNISGGGICFTSAYSVPNGTMLALEVLLPEAAAPIISMGRVCWCVTSTAEADAFDIGVEFWWIGWKDEVAQNQVRNFISDALRGDKS